MSSVRLQAIVVGKVRGPGLRLDEAVIHLRTKGWTELSFVARADDFECGDQVEIRVKRTNSREERS